MLIVKRLESQITQKYIGTSKFKGLKQHSQECHPTGFELFIHFTAHRLAVCTSPQTNKHVSTQHITTVDFCQLLQVVLNAVIPDQNITPHPLILIFLLCTGCLNYTNNLSNFTLYQPRANVLPQKMYNLIRSPTQKGRIASL